MLNQSLYHTYQRYRTLRTHKIRVLPIAILMPHSACNCRCVMCDIWKDNKNLKQLSEADIRELLISFKELQTKQVVMSGGEALLNRHFFRFCELLREQQISISLLSTGISLQQHAGQLISSVNEIIVSLDGNEETHNRIRNIPDAYKKLKEGVQTIKKLQPGFRITGRSVIHRLNYHVWSELIESAREIGLDQISFLPADVSSHAFNREVLWSAEKQHEVMPGENELPAFRASLDLILQRHAMDFERRFIAESPEKLAKIYQYYAAHYQLNSFPYKKCNAPWVSAVIEADGTVRPCFFHPAAGNIHTDSFEEIMNSGSSIDFRKALNTDTNEICKKCVCYLNLPPRMNPGIN